jgi:hypothetical protein
MLLQGSSSPAARLCAVGSIGILGTRQLRRKKLGELRVLLAKEKRTAVRPT